MVVFLCVGGPPAYADSGLRGVVGGRRRNGLGFRIGGLSIGNTGFAPTLLLLPLLLGEVSLTSLEGVIGFGHGGRVPEDRKPRV